MPAEEATHITEAIPPPKERKPFRKQAGHLCKTTMEAVKLSAQYDIPPDQAYQALNGRLPAPDTLKRMEKHIEKWSLHHPASLKAASKSIKAFAAGQEVNGIKPKDSTVLAAATRIVDQTDPVIKRSENLNINADLHPVDLAKYRA